MKEICSLFFNIFLFFRIWKKKKKKVSNAAFLPFVQEAVNLGKKKKDISLDSLLSSKHCSFAWLLKGCKVRCTKAIPLIGLTGNIILSYTKLNPLLSD